MSFFQILRSTFRRFLQFGGPLVSAATSFYVLLSAAPLMVVAVAVAGSLFGRKAAHRELTLRLSRYIGEEGTALAMNALEELSQSASGFWASLGGLAIVAFGASQIFASAQRSLNQIWGVQLRPGRSLGKVTQRVAQKRLTSFVMVFAGGVTLSLTLAAQALWLSLGHWAGWIPRSAELAYAVDLIGLVLMLSGIFSVMFRWLPDANVSWRDALRGAGVTAVLFLAGSFLAAIYARQVAFSSAYGAAGGLAVIVLWVYYSAQVFYFGATFTYQWAQERGAGIVPQSHAVRVIEDSGSRAGIHQGM